jgi:predicted  nucleic acid-binding Zn-ribbon protein
MLMKQLVWEMYEYNRWHDVLSGLCEQEERANLAGEVESAQGERSNLEYQLDSCLKEMNTLNQMMEKEMSDHQVNRSTFSRFQNRIICFHLPIPKEW